MNTETTDKSRHPVAPRPRRSVPRRNILALTLALLACARIASAEPRPNVLWVVLDDARADDVRFLPSVRALAARGTNYTRAIAPFSLCTPSRASMLTGNTPAVHGIRNNRGQDFDPSSTIAVWLQNAGYRNGLAGKYLNQAPRPNWPRQPGWEFWRPFYGHDDYGREQTRALLSDAVAFLDDTDPRPWFLYIGLAGPHGPLFGPPGVCDIEPPPLPQPPSFDTRYLGLSLETKRWPQRISSLCGIDLFVRGLLDALDARGLTENTIVVVTSDQGYHVGEHGELGKGTLYEEVIRVPLVIAGPGFEARENRQVVSTIDIAPTLAEIAGAHVPPIEGRSLLSGTERRYAPIETAHCTGKRRARTKTTWCGGETLHFDLREDPFEMAPVAGEGQ